jgi:hypothetical protein
VLILAAGTVTGKGLKKSLVMSQRSFGELTPTRRILREHLKLIALVNKCFAFFETIGSSPYQNTPSVGPLSCAV